MMNLSYENPMYKNITVIIILYALIVMLLVYILCVIAGFIKSHGLLTLIRYLVHLKFLYMIYVD